MKKTRELVLKILKMCNNEYIFNDGNFKHYYRKHNFKGCNKNLLASEIINYLFLNL